MLQTSRRPSGRATAGSLGIALLALLIAIALYWPIARHPNSSVLWEPGDLTSSARDYWAAHELGKTPFSFVKDTLYLAPGGQIVSPAVQLANAVQPLVVLALQPVAGYLGAFNLFVIFGIALTLTLMFRLLRSQGFGRPACAVGALAFASSQFTIEQLFYGHSAFAQMWVFPALLAGLVWSVNGGRTARAVVPGLLLALAFYTSSYLGLFAAAAALVFIAAYLLEPGRDVGSLARRVGIGLSTAAAALIPAVLAPWLTPASSLDLPQWGKANLIGSNLKDLVLPSTHHPLYGHLVGAVFGAHVGESVEFFGYGVLALATYSAIRIFRGRQRVTLVTRFALFSIPVGWLLSFPAYLTIGGHSIPLPDAADTIGGEVSWWRIYARFACLAGFGLVILAASALDRLLRHNARTRIVGLAAIAVIAFEAIPGAPAPSTRLTPDFATRWLEEHPGGLVASYPLVTGPKNNDAWDRAFWGFYYLQIYYHHPIFAPPQGAPEPTVTGLASYLAENLSDPETPGILRAEGVRYVVVRDDLYRQIGESSPSISGMKLAASSQGTRIFRVVAQPTDLVQLLNSKEPGLARSFVYGAPRINFVSHFYPPERYHGWPSARWMSQTGSVEVRPAVGYGFIVYRLTLWAFSNATPRRLVISESGHPIATFTIPTNEVMLRTTLRLPGPERLSFNTSPGPTELSASDPRTGSLYLEHLDIEPITIALSREPAG